MIFIAVSEKMPNGQVFREDLTHFIGEVELSGLFALTGHGHLSIFKVNAVEVERMDLSDPETGLIHQSIDGIVTDTKYGFAVNGKPICCPSLLILYVLYLLAACGINNEIRRTE